MKKLLSIIIGLAIILPLSFVLINQSVSAKVLTTCNPKKFEDYLKKDKKAVEKLISSKKFDDLEFRLRFEKVRTKYHDHVKCVFDASMIATLGSAGGVQEHIPAGSLPNLDNFLPDLLNPSKACLNLNKIKRILDDTSPTNLVAPMLKTYNLYVAHLKYLYSKVSATPTITSSSGNDFETIFKNNKKFKLIMENEIQNSLIALDAAFIALKELRQAFIMHVHFQCMLKNLETYRKVMSNVRSIVTTLPSIITDASIHR